MAKDILAFFGLIFLTLLILVGVGLMGIFYDDLGIVQVPERIRNEVTRWTEPGEVVVKEFNLGEAEWSNPLEGITSLPDLDFTMDAEVPAFDPTAVPVPTATPVQPLKPGVYRVEAVVRLKEFVAAVETWLVVNKEVSDDGALVNDPNWQARAQAAVDNVLLTARVLDDIGPAPAGYEGVDDWLFRVHQEAQVMHSQYSQALANQAGGTSGSEQFRAAGESFTRMKEYLSGAVQEMLALGWSLE